MKNTTHLLLCIILCACAALTLLQARIVPGMAILSPVFLGLAVFLTFQMKEPAPGLLLISMTAVLSLSLRFSSLTWGDPWQDLESVMEVLIQGSTSPVGYRLQQPILPAVVSTLSLCTGIPPLLIQKISVPLIGSLSAPILLLFSREYIGDKSALTAAFIYLAGIPYIHWASQGVRETIGIPFFLLALFITILVIKGKNKEILILVPAITGLILAHHQSAIFLVAIISGIVLVSLYIFGRYDEIRGVGIRGILFLICFSWIILLWWEVRIPFIYSSFLVTLNQITGTESSLSIFPLVLISLFLSLLIIIPILRPDFPGLLRKKALFCNQYLPPVIRVMQTILIAGMAILGLLILIGRTPFTVSYSPFMIIPILCIFIVSVIGIPVFLTPSRFFYIVWFLVPGILLITGFLIAIPLSSPGLNLQIDPFRFIGYLWPAASVIAGLTIVQYIQNERIFQLIVPLIFIVLLMNSFPPVVFLGVESDNRSLVISHQPGELLAVEWIKEQNITGKISSDRYGIAPARWLNPLGYRVIEPQGRPGKWNGTEYWMLTERMQKYANFNEWIVKSPYPFGNDEQKRIQSFTDREYDNGYAYIYEIRKSGKSL